MIKYFMKSNSNRVNDSDNTKTEFWEFNNGVVNWYVKKEGHSSNYVICKCGEWIGRSFEITYAHLIVSHSFPKRLADKAFRIVPVKEE